MRLPQECYQMKQLIETHLPHLTQTQLTGLAWVGVRRHPGRQRLPERRGRRPLYPGQLAQPAPVSQGMALRRQRPGPSRQDPTGGKHLLRAPAPLGPGLVAFPTAGPGGGSHVQKGRLRCHRHQRSLPGLRHSRGLAHPPCQPAGVLDGPHSGTAAGTGPGGAQGNDRGGAVRPGHRQSEMVEADTRSRLAPLHEVSEKHHLLRRGRPKVAGPRLPFPVPIPPGSAGAPPSDVAPPNAVAPCWRSGTQNRRSPGSS